MALDAAQGMDRHGSSERVVRSVAWSTSTVCLLAESDSSQKVSPKLHAPESQPAISALGSAEEGALKSLQDALQKAKQSAHVPPIRERLDACTQFLERAKKRLARADVELLFQTERAQLATELAEGQARFEALRAEAGVKPPSHPAAPKDLGSELERMQSDRRPSAGAIPVGWVDVMPVRQE